MINSGGKAYRCTSPELLRQQCQQICRPALTLLWRVTTTVCEPDVILATDSRAAVHGKSYPLDNGFAGEALVITYVS